MCRGAKVALATAKPSLPAMAIVSWLPAYSDSWAPARLVSRTPKSVREALGDPVADTLAVGTGLVRTPVGEVVQAVRRTTASPNAKRVTGRSTHGQPGWFHFISLFSVVDRVGAAGPLSSSPARGEGRVGAASCATPGRRWDGSGRSRVRG